MSGHFPAVDRVAHGTLDVRAAVGAAVVLLVSLIASRYVIEWLVTYEWPIVVYAGIAVLLGYGPSVLWCVVAARRWGTGRFFEDTGMQIRWVDLGWGPLVWVAAIAGQLVAVVVIEAFGIPLVSNTEGISDLARDRTYVISILVTTVVAAPVVEELVFRGVMLRGLRSRLPAVAAVGRAGRGVRPRPLRPGARSRQHRAGARADVGRHRARRGRLPAAADRARRSSPTPSSTAS